MGVTTKVINQLRQKTGLGILNCKKALVESKGNLEKAIELLRKKGAKISQSRANQATTEGVIKIAVNEAKTTGAILALGSETDFVANNKGFQKLAQSLVQVGLEQKITNHTDLLSQKLENETVEEKITTLRSQVNENIRIQNYALLTADIIDSYLHGSKMGVLLALSGNGKEHDFEVSQDIAMQIAANKPLGIQKEDIPQELLAKEKEIIQEQFQKENKPENILEKILEGRINKFLKEHTLLEQGFIKDPNITVKDYLKQHAPNTTLQQFILYTI